MSPDIRKLKSGGWARKGYPEIPATVLGSGLPTNLRPEGPEFVRFEDLWVAGDTLQQTLGRETLGRTMTFPPGVFKIPNNFSNGYLDGVRIGNGGANGCNGIAGSGIDQTFFEMDSSSRTEPNGTNFEANNYFLMQMNGENWGAGKRPGMQFLNFTLRGTRLGNDHSHNGLRADSLKDLLMQGVKVTGIKGANKIPPGETGSISLFRNEGGVIQDFELDGRRDGARVASALLMPNNGSNLTVRNGYLHDALYGGGGIAWYVYNGGKVYDTRSHRIGSGSGIYAGYGFNHEQAVNIEYWRPDIICARDTPASQGGGGGGTLHMSFNADSARGGVDSILRVNDPMWDGVSVGAGQFCVETWDLGANQMQRTRPVVKRNGVLLPFTYILPSKYGAPLTAAA